MNKKADLVSTYFTSIYLTFIALLQCVTLSLLVPNMITYFKMAELPLTDIRILPFLLTLLIIFVVWHHYVNGIVYLRWFPNIIDAIIPFMVSITQFFLISYVTIKNSVSDINVAGWTKAFGIFLVIGSFAYFAASWRHEKNLFTNIMNEEHAAIHSKRIRKYYKNAGYSILLQGLFAFLIILIREEQLLWVSLLFFLVHIVYSEHLVLSRIKPHFLRAIDEYDEFNK